MGKGYPYLYLSYCYMEDEFMTLICFLMVSVIIIIYMFYLSLTKKALLGRGTRLLLAEVLMRHTVMHIMCKNICYVKSDNRDPLYFSCYGYRVIYIFYSM